MEAEACAPLVDSLLARLPALGAAALLAALEAEGAEPYRRLVARAHLTLGEAAVDALLAPGTYELPPTSYQPPAAGPARGATRWEALLRRHAASIPGVSGYTSGEGAAAAGWTALLEELMQGSTRLRACGGLTLTLNLTRTRTRTRTLTIGPRRDGQASLHAPMAPTPNPNPNPSPSPNPNPSPSPNPNPC